MFSYEDWARRELNYWMRSMRKRPSIIQILSKGTQRKLNSMLPEKYHEFVTMAIKNMTKGALYGSKFGINPPLIGFSLKERERIVKDKTKMYVATATIEGAATGAGGFVAGLADFPLLMGIKMRFLFEIAAVYGFDVNDYRERLYLLHIFQLAFSSKSHVNKVFSRMENWQEYVDTLPENMDDFEWRDFQQQYRDYLDIAKLLQMLPVVGALVGSYVNNKLLKKLSETAMNSYRMRIL
ncbi:MAG: EcsC family protein [Bacillota bacterium]